MREREETYESNILDDETQIMKDLNKHFKEYFKTVRAKSPTQLRTNQTENFHFIQLKQSYQIKWYIERRTRQLLTIFEQIYRYIDLYGDYQENTWYDSMFSPSWENEVKSWKMTSSYHIM